MDDNTCLWGSEWHELVDLELRGQLTPAQAVQLAEMRQAIDAESTTRVTAMREEFARQDRMFAEAVEAYQKSRPATAAKSASNRK